MHSITCPHCSRVGSLKVAPPPGTRVRCPGCGETFTTPSDATDYPLDADDAPSPIPTRSYQPAAPFVAPPQTAPAPPVSVSVVADSSVPDLFNSGLFKPSPPGPVRAFMPPEPWYYRWLSAIGQVIFVMALIGEACMVLAALIIFLVSVVVSGQSDHALLGIGLGFGVGLGYVLWGLVILTPSVILALLLRLVVDAARNIRMMTYR